MASVAVASTPSSLKFYTNQRCPWAQRAQIALKELQLPYEEIIIDLDTPRPDWYLKINPRGLVPSINYTGGGVSDQIITESAVVSQFLADAHPSHLTPASNEGEAKAALFRARANFFVDTFISKVNGLSFGILKADDGDKPKLTADFVAAIEKEIEPLLKDAGPFFAGSKQFTIAEVLTAPFVLRFQTYAEAGLIDTSYVEGIAKLPAFSKWAAAVVKQPSVQFGYESTKIVEGTKKRIASLSPQAWAQKYGK